MQFLIAILVAAMPDRSPDAAPPAIRYEYESGYGAVKIDGDRFFLKGVHYTASGTIRADGSLFIVWTAEGSNVVYLGVYRRVGVDFIGVYCLACEGGLDEDGELCGNTSNDQIIKVR